MTLLELEMQACSDQATWSRNSTYEWESYPTIAKSRYNGTWVTYVGCVLQRIGITDEGEYIWHDEQGDVTHANSKMVVTYTNQTPGQLKNSLQAGDILMDGDKTDVGLGSHVFILTGTWNGNNPTAEESYEIRYNHAHSLYLQIAYLYSSNNFFTFSKKTILGFFSLTILKYFE